MMNNRRWFAVVNVTLALAVLTGPRSAQAESIEIAFFVATLHPGLVCDLQPEHVTFTPNSLATATQIDYTFKVGATLNGSPFASAGTTLPALLYFSPAPGGAAGLVPGTAMQIGSVIQQSVDVDFNIVTQGSVNLLSGELKGILTVDTTTDDGSLNLLEPPFPKPYWTSDLDYAGVPNLIGVGMPLSLSQVATLSGEPLGITPAGNITPFSANLTGQFSVVPEPTSLTMAGLGLIVIATASLIRRRAVRTV
jgi:hypothetical protein